MTLAWLLAATLSLAQAPPLTKAEQLQEAARKGDAATVKKLLDEGVDVNTRYRYNATALFYASDHGHVEVVKVLLDKGADLNVKDTFYGFTPLILAMGPAQKKKPEHAEIAKLLIAKGAPGQEVALETAIRGNDAALATFILEQGKIPVANLTDSLEAARAQNKTEIVAMLEKAGAKPYEVVKLDAAYLATLAGSYKNAAGLEFTVVVNGERLSLGPATAPPAQRLTLIAKDATSFRALGAGQPGLAVFKIENDKATGVTVTFGPNNTVLTRVEGK
jgi:ankyrin repeat protein